MSPPIPTFEFPKSDSAQSSEYPWSVNFSAGSTDAAQFAHEKSRVSSRSKPRLMKTRRRQMPDGNGLKGTDFLSGFEKGSSDFVKKGTEGFVFGASKAAPMANEGLDGLNKNGFPEKINLENGFCDSATGDSASQVKLEQRGLNNSGTNSIRDDSEKLNAADFVFGASKIDGAAERKIPSRKDSIASEKVCSSGFNFPFNLSDSSSKNHENFVFTSHNRDFKFDIGLGNTFAGKNGDAPYFANSGKENVEIGSKSKDSSLNGGFVFGASKGKGGVYSGGNTKPVNKMNQVNKGNGDDSSADVNFEFKSSCNSGDSFEQDPAFSISNKMKKLGISDSKAEAASDVFVFGGNWNNSGLVEEKHPSNQKTPGTGCFSKSNSESIRNNSSLFQGFEVPSMNKDENSNISFGGKLSGLDSDVKFSFSSNNLFPGVENANRKSVRGKKTKKKNGKLGQRTVVGQCFLQENHKSPGCGSPMDFSPYQGTSASHAPEADNGTGVKGESTTNKKNIFEQWEKPQDDKSDSVLSPSLPAEDGLSAVRNQYKKKYRLKVGLSPTVQRNNSDKENCKKEPTRTPDELCEHWRARGNEAYHAGKLSKAEEFYSMGIDSAPHVSAVGYPLKPLLLCYSNRAATRMSLGRIREAIADCTKASELDPDFMKVILRAGNCYLVLGEVEDAIQCYSKCVGDGASICLDRRITIEAADNLQKARKVANYMHQSGTLLQEGTDDAAGLALTNIEEALLISCFSERLLQMKAEALYIMQMYDEVIQLCDRTLDIAEKNSRADVLANSVGDAKLWRWHLQSKSHYRLGRLDIALDFIKKQEKVPISSKSGDVTRDSIALATNIQELLSLKKSGNEAFNSGRYTEAIESYTAAISKSFESRAFMAVCFCNRAAAYQALNQVVDAISDCSVAVALDENYPKAISRRGSLHEMIRDYKQALNDTQRLVSLLESQSLSKTPNGSGGGSARDLRKARRHLASIEEKAKKEIPLDLYLILGIKTSDSEAEIKKAYRKAALRHHPDKAGQVLVRCDAGDNGKLWRECGEKIHNDADRLFKIIGEAYAVLSDPSKRSKYDMEEDIRNSRRDSNRNSSCGHPSTSYRSPYERGSCSGRSGYYYSSTSFGRNSSRRNWYEAKS